MAEISRIARAYYGFMWAHPGKKLLFMGQEFGQTPRVEFRRELPDGRCSTFRPHQGIQAWSAISTGSTARRRRCMRATAKATASAGSWSTTTTQSVFAWLRFGADGRPAGRGRLQFHAGAAPRLPDRPADPGGRWREMLNTDAAIYGGSGLGNLGGVAAEERSLAWSARVGGRDAAAAGDLCSSNFADHMRRASF